MLLFSLLAARCAEAARAPAQDVCVHRQRRADHDCAVPLPIPDRKHRRPRLHTPCRTPTSEKCSQSRIQMNERYVC